jgi:2,3-bisphosphoglycerate-independent phosphoglycerate mutase
MANFTLMRELSKADGGKIILLVMDGLGGLPHPETGKTELETAHTPNMDRLVKAGSVGLSIPVERGIAPGSGPAHLALFGYDPIQYDVGRGVLSAFGVGLFVGESDVAARVNFATMDADGVITDRRAGRIATEAALTRLEKLKTIQLPGVKIELQSEADYRFVLVMRGEGLSADISDTDPQSTGRHALTCHANDATNAAAVHTADLVNQWVKEANRLLVGAEPANTVLMRGFATDPKLPKFKDVYKLNPACVAVYPMYKGVSQLVGMKVIETGSHDSAQDEFNHVARIWNDHDFVFCHIKYTDSRGEDGDFAAKVKVIEEVDAALPTLIDLQPAVLIITGDHSTPATYRAHSWHPVPTLLYAPGTHMPDYAEEFGERACLQGALGQFHATDLMPLALAHAKRLDKFGA